jgi:hypothetical protein
VLIQNINHEKVIFSTCLQIVDITGNYEQKTSKAVLSSGHIKDSTNAIMASIWRKQKHPQPSNANKNGNLLMKTFSSLCWQKNIICTHHTSRWM